MGPALLHENEPLGRDHCGHHHPPGRPQELIAFGSDTPPFFLVEPVRAMARHMVERLTESPVMTSTYSQRSLRVAKGRSLRFPSSSFIAFWSSFGAEPGLFFGARGSPLRALFTYRLTEERLTRKVRAAWALDIPLSTQETILRLRSSE